MIFGSGVFSMILLLGYQLEQRAGCEWRRGVLSTTKALHGVIRPNRIE
jgi:hypothetical protein